MRTWSFLLLALPACVSDSVVTLEAGADATADTGPEDAAAMDGGSDASSWSPSSLGTNLVVWLMGSKVETTNNIVTKWIDQSTYGNHALAPNITFAPTLDSNAANNQDALLFNKSTIQIVINDSASLQWGDTSEFLIEAVMSFSQGVANQEAYVWNKSPVVQTKTGYVYGPGVRFNGNGGSLNVPELTLNSNNDLLYSSAVFGDKAFHVVGVRRLAPTLVEMRIDGMVKQQMLAGAVDVSAGPVDGGSGTNVTIGATAPLLGAAFLNPIRFDIAEIIAVHPSVGAISDGVVKNVETYLKAKYATP